MQIPNGVGGKFKNGIISVGLDGNVCAINIEEGTTQFTFTGHGTMIKAIFWRIADEVLMVQGQDGRIHVWQLRTGHLDRILFGPHPDILAECDHVFEIQYDPLASVNFKKTLSGYSLIQPIQETRPTVGILQVNLKRLIDEIYNGQQLLTPILPPKNYKFRDPITSVNKEEKSKNPMDLLKQAFKPLNKKETAVIEPSQGASTPMASENSFSKRIEAPDPNIVQTLFSVLLSWGIDANLDETCQKMLGLVKPMNCICLGMRGAGGYLNFPFPAKQRNKWQDWNISGHFSAQRLLGIMSLMKSVMSISGLEDQAIKLITHYGVQIPDQCPDYKPSSLDYLIRFWLDPIQDVSQATKSCFETTLAILSPEKKQQLINEYRNYCKLFSSSTLVKIRCFSGCTTHLFDISPHGHW